MHSAPRTLACEVGLLLVLLWASTAIAQTTSGTLSGTVKDAQGGILPGGTVELTSETRGTKVPAVVTSGTGDFTFVNIQPDTYRIQVSMPGFRTLTHSGVSISAGDRVSIGMLTLEIGGAQETVSVTAEAPLLQTQTGDRSFVATQNQVDNLPLNARSFMAMAQLAPGVVNNGDNDYTVSRVGGSNRENAWLMDGASMMDTGSNRPVTQINTEAVQEVKVLVSGFQAEYGRAAGMVITGVSKSGTNQFHGSVYDVERHSDWNSISRTNKLNGDPKPVRKERDYGFSLGGPVGRSGGSNNLFFFFHVEASPRTSGQTVNRFRVPTALERMGDFSQSLDNNGARYNLIRDPLSTSPCAAANTSGCFSANAAGITTSVSDGGILGKIPTNRLYAPGMNILNWYPEPNVEFVPGQNFNFEATTVTQSLTAFQPNIRFDYQPTPRLRLAYRYSRFQQAQHFVTLGNVPGFNDSKQPEPNSYSTTFNVNYTLNDQTFLEATFGWAADHTIASCPLNSGNTGAGQGAEFCRNGLIVNPSATRTAAGFDTLPQIYPDANIINPAYYVYERLNVVGPAAWDGTRFNMPPSFSWGSRIGGTQPVVNYNGFGTNPTSDISLSITRLAGRHTWKAGFYRASVFKTASAGAFGTISFQQDTVGTNPFDTSFGWSNAAIGSFSSFSQPERFNETQQRWVLSEGFIQDNFKVTPKLSLDYGVRFTHQGELRDPLGQQSNFDFGAWQAANSAVAIYRPACANGVFPCSGTNRQAQDPITGRFLGPNSSVLIGTVVPNTGNLLAGVTPVPGDRAPYDWPELAVAPRFGAAYDPFGTQRTVLRGTVGLFFPRTGGGQTGATNPGQNTTTTVRFSNFQSMGTAGLQPVSVPAIAGNEQGKLPLPKQLQWNAGVQQLMPMEIMVDLSYVGIRGWDTPESFNYNVIDLGSAYLPEYQDPTLSSTVPGGNFLPQDLARVYPGLANITMQQTTSRQEDWSHTLQFSANRRIRNGFSLGFSSTVDLLEKSTSALRLEHAPDGTVRVRDDQKRADELLGSTIDRKLVWKLNFVWELPKVTAAGARMRALGWVVNDWQLAGVWTADTGTAYTPGFTYATGGTSTNLTGSPNYAARLRLVGDPGRGCTDDHYRMFNTAAFQGPVYGSDGLESGDGYLRMCGRNRWDLALSRTINLSGGRSISLRADFFNAFNQQPPTTVNSTMQLSSPAAPGSINNLPFDANGELLPARSQPKTAGFGAVTGYQNPRTIQLQARFRF